MSANCARPWPPSPGIGAACRYAFVADVVHDDRGTRERGGRTIMEKLTIYIGLMIGGIIGGYLPVVLFHVSSFSWVSLICGFVGCIVGAWLGWKLTLWIGE
jgi:MFS family permease